MRDFVYLAPETLEEAAALKLEHDDKAIFMAGATDVVIRLRDHLIAPDYVIDLKNIPDIGGITFSETDGLHIGALATMTQIATNADVLAHYPNLAEAAAYVGELGFYLLDCCRDAGCRGVHCTAALADVVLCGSQIADRRHLRRFR